MVEIVVPLASWQQVVLYFFKSGGDWTVILGPIWPFAEDSLQTLCQQNISQLISLNPDRLFPEGGSQIWDLDDARNMNFATLPALAYDGLSAAVQGK